MIMTYDPVLWFSTNSDNNTLVCKIVRFWASSRFREVQTQISLYGSAYAQIRQRNTFQINLGPSQNSLQVSFPLMSS